MTRDCEIGVETPRWCQDVSDNSKSQVANMRKREDVTYSLLSGNLSNGSLVGLNLVSLEAVHVELVSNTLVLLWALAVAVSTSSALGEHAVGRGDGGIEIGSGDVGLVNDNVGVLDDIACLDVADLEVGWSGLSDWCCQSTGEEGGREGDKGLREEHVGWLLRRCGCG